MRSYHWVRVFSTRGLTRIRNHAHPSLYSLPCLQWPRPDNYIETIYACIFVAQYIPLQHIRDPPPDSTLLFIFFATNGLPGYG